MEGRHVALLRGINVGRAKRVAMADLRSVATSLGLGEVRTLLNSGNLVFTSRPGRAGRIAERIQARLAQRLGVSSRCMVLTARAFARVVEENTLAPRSDDPSRLQVAFCDDRRRLDQLRPLAHRDWNPEALAVGSDAAYLWCPAGVLESSLLEAVGRVLGDRTTMRNWATVTRIHAALALPELSPSRPPRSRAAAAPRARPRSAPASRR